MCSSVSSLLSASGGGAVGLWDDHSGQPVHPGSSLSLMSAGPCWAERPRSCWWDGCTRPRSSLKLLLSLTSNLSFKGPQKPIPRPLVPVQNLSSFRLSQLWKHRIWPEQGKMNFSTLFQILKKLDQGEYSTQRCWVLKQVRSLLQCDAHGSGWKLRLGFRPAVPSRTTCSACSGAVSSCLLLWQIRS